MCVPWASKGVTSGALCREERVRLEEAVGHARALGLLATHAKVIHELVNGDVRAVSVVGELRVLSDHVLELQNFPPRLYVGGPPGGVCGAASGGPPGVGCERYALVC